MSHSGPTPEFADQGLIGNSPLYRGAKVLAPHPVGFLHLGHASTFAIAAARAVRMQGSLILRIEDLDHQRCRPEYTGEGIFTDLKWWGLTWERRP